MQCRLAMNLEFYLTYLGSDTVDVHVDGQFSEFICKYVYL